MGAAREMPGACAGPGVNYRTSKGTSESAAPPTAMPPQIVQTKFHSHSIGPSQPKLYMHSPRGKGGDQIRTASRAHTHARTCTRGDAGVARADNDRHARSATSRCEYMHNGGGGGIAVRFCRACTHTHALACVPTDEPPGVSRGKSRLPGISETRWNGQIALHPVGLLRSARNACRADESASVLQHRTDTTAVLVAMLDMRVPATSCIPERAAPLVTSCRSAELFLFDAFAHDRPRRFGASQALIDSCA